MCGRCMWGLTFSCMYIIAPFRKERNLCLILHFLTIPISKFLQGSASSCIQNHSSGTKSMQTSSSLKRKTPTICIPKMIKNTKLKEFAKVWYNWYHVSCKIMYRVITKFKISKWIGRQLFTREGSSNSFWW